MKERNHKYLQKLDCDVLELEWGFFVYMEWFVWVGIFLGWFVALEFFNHAIPGCCLSIVV